MELLLNTTIWIILFGLVYALILSKLSFYQANRWFLLTGIVAAFILPFLHFNVVIEKTVSDTIPLNTVVKVEQEVIQSLNWVQILIIVYVLGVLYFAIKILINLWSMYKRYKSSNTFTDNGFKITETDQDISAFSFFNWIVINTSDFDENEQQILLNHEKVHAKQWHSIDIIMAHLLTTVQWYNPLAYWYKNQIIHNLEYIADQETQDLQIDRSKYAKMIVKTTVIPLQYQLVNNFNSSLIKKRIHMLHKSPSNPNKKWFYLLIIPAVALVFSAFNRQEIIQFNHPEDVVVQDSILIKSKNISFVINKNSTNEFLIKTKKFFKLEDIDFDYSKVKRNSKGEITGISLSIDNKNNSATYNVNGDKPIKPIEIMFDLSNQELGIGTVTNQKNNPLIDIEAQTMVFISEDDDLKDTYHWKEGDSLKTYTIIVDKKIDEPVNKNEKHKNFTVPSKSKIEIIENDNGEIIYKVDGKEVSKEKLEKIENENIEEVRVFKRNFEKQKKIIVIEGEDEETAVYKVNGKVMSREEVENMDPEIIKEVRVFKNDKIKNTEDINVDIDKKKKIIVIEGDDEGTAIYKVNGKELTKEEFEKLDPDEIKEVQIIKK